MIHSTYDSDSEHFDWSEQVEPTEEEREDQYVEGDTITIDGEEWQVIGFEKREGHEVMWIRNTEGEYYKKESEK